MNMSVAEYARRRGISRQRVLSMINAGQIEAERVGRSWVIDERKMNQRSSFGRPLGRRMVSILNDSIAGSSLADVTPEERHFARKYIDRLRVSEDPGDLLYSWMRSRETRVIDLAANAADLADIARDERVVASGVSDPRAGLSAAREFEGYVAEVDVDSFVSDNLLVSSSEPNVRLHIVDTLPPRPVPLGLILADLAAWNRPREDGRIVELLGGIEWSL
jgi:excisionase family DNA binding protein